MSASLSLPQKLYVLYGVSLAALLCLLRWLELQYMIVDHEMNIYIGSIAVLFTGLGIWLAHKLMKPKVETVIVEKIVQVELVVPQIEAALPFSADEAVLLHTGITGRELEVLRLMAVGQSNQEIATQLFVSLNTVKSHTSSLFSKLDVKRRTQAVDKARRLGLIG